MVVKNFDINHLVVVRFIWSIIFSLCRFAFPTVLVIYQMIALLSSIVVVDIGFILGGTVLCNSQDLIENISPGQATMYCQFSGIYVYQRFSRLSMSYLHLLTFLWKYFYSCITMYKCDTLACVRTPTIFAARSHVKPHMHNNKVIALHEVLVYHSLLIEVRSYKDSFGQRWG